MELGVGCCCVLDAIPWKRSIRLIGPVTAHEDMSDWSREWTTHATGMLTASIPAGQPLDPPDLTEPIVFNQPCAVSAKMAPLRFELGQFPVEHNPYRYENIRQTSNTSGASSWPPPLTGHLRRTDVTQITFPAPIYVKNGLGFFNNGPFDACLGSHIAAYELFVNGESVKRDLVSVGVVLSSPGVYRGAPLHVMAIEVPLSLAVTDVVTIDIYTTIKANRTSTGTAPVFGDPPTFRTIGFGNPPILPWNYDIYGMYFDPDDEGLEFLSTFTRSNRSLSRLEMVFSDNGPGGVTSVNLTGAPGWTAGELGSDVDWINNEDGRSFHFEWNREIPYVELNYPDQNTAHPGFGVVRYYPADSGDYDTIYSRDSIFTAPTTFLEHTYGIWNPSVATVFTHAHRRTSNVNYRWQSPPQIPASHLSGFPATVTIQPVS